MLHRTIIIEGGYHVENYFNTEFHEALGFSALGRRLYLGCGLLKNLNREPSDHLFYIPFVKGHSAGESTIPLESQSQSENMGKTSTGSADTSSISREVAHLAFTKVKQDDWLNIRQQEQLRRALMALGEALGWAVTSANSEDPIAAISKSTRKMMSNGARSLKRSLAKKMATKKAEITELKKVAKSIRRLAENPNTIYPLEITYSRSARDSVQSMFTKTENIEVNDALETLGCAESIERNLDHWTTLRDQMIAELKVEQKHLSVMTQTLSQFVKSMHRLLGEVIATLS